MIGAFLLSEVEKYPCPIARCFLDPTIEGCRGAVCPLFRQAPMVCDGAWKAALLKLAAEIDDKTATKMKAAALIAADPEAYGLERRYYCGLGGEVKA